MHDRFRRSFGPPLSGGFAASRHDRESVEALLAGRGLVIRTFPRTRSGGLSRTRRLASGPGADALVVFGRTPRILCASPGAGRRTPESLPNQPTSFEFGPNPGPHGSTLARLRSTLGPSLRTWAKFGPNSVQYWPDASKLGHPLPEFRPNLGTDSANSGHVAPRSAEIGLCLVISGPKANQFAPNPTKIDRHLPETASFGPVQPRMPQT